MSVLVVGSVALDSVETPFGKVHEVLGGSSIYFSLAASLYTKVRLVGVVGTDFPQEHIELLKTRGVDTRGLQIAKGETFRWAGHYDYDLNTTKTLDTRLNVFASFHPTMPLGYETSDFVFLANIDPDLQCKVLQQAKNHKLCLMDTMDFWIKNKRDSLINTMGLVDIVTMNEAELRMLAETNSILTAVKRVQQLGPKALIIKKGEYGAAFFSDNAYFFAPAYPLEEVKDPTGAGDSFAGGFVGYLASQGEVTASAIKRAVIHGSVVASFTVQEFSVDALRSLTLDEVTERYCEFRQFTHFETPQTHGIDYFAER